MRAAAQRVAGRTVEKEGRVALILQDIEPAEEETNLVVLRYAFVVRGPGVGDHIFPAFILDDWGREIRSLKLYQWVRENGERFPRAEIFGFERDGRETQCFLRELELYARLPCYAFGDAHEPVSGGQLVHAVFMPDASVDQAVQVTKPGDIGQPLRRAMVTWWKMPASGFTPDLSLLSVPPEPGY